MTDTAINYSMPVRQMYSPEKAKQMEAIAQLIGDTTSIQSLDEDKFNRMKEIVDGIEVAPESKFKPLKTVTTAVLLTGASVLSAHAFGRRIVGFLSKNTGLMESLSKRLMNTIGNAKKYINNSGALKQKNIKGAIARFGKSTVEFIEKQSKKGIENELKVLKGKGSKTAKTALQGQNLIKKAVGAGFGASAGVSTLTSATKDSDGNGIADIAEKGSTTDALTKAAMSCMMDE